MNLDGGWIELVEPGTQQVRARGHLLVSDLPLGGGWRGQLQSVRLAASGSPLASGTYFARFPRCGDGHVVRLDIRGADARVECDDAELPAVLRELSDGE